MSFGKYFKFLLVLLIIGGAAWAFVGFYPYIFSRRVVGVIQNVERVQLNVSLMQTTNEAGSKPRDTIDPSLYSFAVAIREASGEIVTASAQDRQWAVAQPGQCAEAVYYPYPPWMLEKSNTYYNARLEKLLVCPEGTGL